MQVIKCFLVGDGIVDKTCLLFFSYTYANEKPPTVFDKYSANLMAKRTIDFAHSVIRKQMYSYFASTLIDLRRLITSKNKWFPEIQYHAPGVPVILVGLNLDLRNDAKTVKELQEKRQVPVSKAQGEALCAEIKAYKYLECSALTQEGPKQVYDEAIRCVLINQSKPKEGKRQCLIL